MQSTELRIPYRRLKRKNSNEFVFMGNRFESRQPLREPSFRRNNNQTEATKTTPKSIKSIPLVGSFSLSLIFFLF